ncbi:MAG: flagellar filament capping protein FliD [Desulfatiglandales bacterium]
MSAISVSGVSSGVDWMSLIDQLKKAEQSKVELLEKEKTRYQDRMSAWQEINTLLLSFMEEAEDLNRASDFNIHVTSLASNSSTESEDILSASAGTDAAPGTYTVVVQSLAAAEKLATRSFTSQDEALGLSGDLVIGGQSVSVESTDTLLNLRDKINDVNRGTEASGVRASIVNYGDNGYRLILTSESEGSSGMSLSNGGAEDLLGALEFVQVQAGADAVITVDGFTVTSESNTIDDVISGVTLDLKQADSDTTVTLTVGRDYEAVKEAIGEFVDSYNEVIKAVNKQFSYDAEDGKAGGPLFGDSTLRAIRSKMTSIVTRQISGASDAFSTLGLIGIKIGTDRTLSIDDNTLQGHLETNFEDVMNLFVANYMSTNGHVSYLRHGVDTQEGTYNIHIDGTDPLEGYFVEPGDASGSGGYLTGESGGADGLVIRYTGTATGEIGTFTLNYGVAELIHRELHQITDSLDGYVANKKESLQSSIDRIEKNIQKTEDRIDRKMEVLTRQYIAMEQALSEMQSLSNWMSQQLAFLQ